MLQVTIIIPSVFWQMYHKYLGFREFSKYGEWGIFAASLGHPKAKRFSAWGGSPLNPWPGTLPLDPADLVIGSRSALAMRVHPRFFDWRHPCVECATFAETGAVTWRIIVNYCFWTQVRLSRKQKKNKDSDITDLRFPSSSQLEHTILRRTERSNIRLLFPILSDYTAESRFHRRCSWCHSTRSVGNYGKLPAVSNQNTVTWVLVHALLLYLSYHYTQYGDIPSTAHFWDTSVPKHSNFEIKWRRSSQSAVLCFGLT